MEDKKDEATVLNTDVEQPQKEENKQNNKEKKQQDNDDKKKTLKTVITSIVSTLLFIIIILLLVLLSLKKCSNKDGGTSSDSSSSSQKYDFDNNKLNDVFKYLVNKQIQLDGFDGTTKDIAVVTYADNYPSNFSLNIGGYNDSKVYYYEITNCEYLGDKNGYGNVISYLLLNDNYQSLNADINLSILDKYNNGVINSKTTTKYVVGTTPTDTRYLSGYYYEDNKYCVYYKKQLEDSIDPFNSNADMVINSDSPLYGYYKDMLIQ